MEIASAAATLVVLNEPAAFTAVKAREPAPVLAAVDRASFTTGDFDNAPWRAVGLALAKRRLFLSVDGAGGSNLLEDRRKERREARKMAQLLPGYPQPAMVTVRLSIAL